MHVCMGDSCMHADTHTYVRHAKNVPKRRLRRRGDGGGGEPLVDAREEDTPGDALDEAGDGLMCICVGGLETVGTLVYMGGGCGEPTHAHNSCQPSTTLQQQQQKHTHRHIRLESARGQFRCLPLLPRALGGLGPALRLPMRMCVFCGCCVYEGEG